MPIEKLRPTYLFDEQHIEQLKHLAPECFTDGKINWEVLKESLGEYLQKEGQDEEHFGLFWPGKREARKLASVPSKNTLSPMLNEGGEEKTSNVFIEGENLEVLKLLQKSYAGKIKMIYIDPPYNTGNDFVYDDNFKESIEDYLTRTGQIDEEGKKLTTNSKADGRFHSKWLSMIYPRLKLARNLLQEDGLIFISIDENEIHNLRAICNEIFGEENFIANIIWQKRTAPDARTLISEAHDYILVFSKNNTTVSFLLNALPLDENRVSNYKNPDNDKRGPWASVDLTGQTGRAPKSQFYTIIGPNGNKYPPPAGRCWALAEKTFYDLMKDNRVWFGSDGNSRPRLKKFLSESEGQRPWTWWDNKNYGHNQEGNKEVMALFDNKLVFDNPKPVKLLKKILQISTSSSTNDIVLDFFAGSGSTAHAILELNEEDSGNRSFITVQMPEIIEKDSSEHKAKSVAYNLGYRKVSDITKERIKRVIKNLKTSKPKNDKKSLIPGFKCYKLKSSNYKIWENITDTSVVNLELKFDAFESPLISNWKPEELLTEIILLEGFPLDCTIERATEYKKNKVQKISSDFCEHILVVCLDKEVTVETIKALQLNDNDVFICLDNAITDEQKVTLSDKGLIKTI